MLNIYNRQALIDTGLELMIGIITILIIWVI